MRWILDNDLLFVKWKDTREVSICTNVYPVYTWDTALHRKITGDEKLWWSPCQHQQLWQHTTNTWEGCTHPTWYCEPTPSTVRLKRKKSGNTVVSNSCITGPKHVSNGWLVFPESCTGVKGWRVEGVVVRFEWLPGIDVSTKVKTTHSWCIFQSKEQTQSLTPRKRGGSDWGVVVKEFLNTPTIIRIKNKGNWSTSISASGETEWLHVAGWRWNDKLSFQSSACSFSSSYVWVLILFEHPNIFFITEMIIILKNSNTTWLTSNFFQPQVWIFPPPKHNLFKS